MMDKGKASPRWILSKFFDPDGKIAEMLKNGASILEVQEKYPFRFIETLEWVGNICLNEGIAEFIDIMCGLGGTLFNSGNAHVGVGNSNAAVNPAQTGLQGGSKAYAPMDLTYPGRTSQTGKWRGTFGPADGNFQWEEYTVANGNSDAAKNLNRCLASKGTKMVNETWALELQITWS